MPPVQKPFASTALQPMLGTLSTLSPAVPAAGSTHSWFGALALQKVCEAADATLGIANSTSIAPANDSSLATRIVSLLARIENSMSWVGAPALMLNPASSQSQSYVSNGTN
jgi:hypothetical protein